KPFDANNYGRPVRARSTGHGEPVQEIVWLPSQQERTSPWRCVLPVNPALATCFAPPGMANRPRCNARCDQRTPRPESNPPRPLTARGCEHAPEFWTVHAVPTSRLTSITPALITRFHQFIYARGLPFGRDQVARQQRLLDSWQRDYENIFTEWEARTFGRNGIRTA